MQEQISPLSYFHPADWCVLAVVLLATAGAAWYGGWRLKKSSQQTEKTALDYLLMGRRLTLPLFVATLVATWYGGIFGVNEITFNYGIYNFVTQGLFWYAAYLIFAFFIAKRVLSFQAVTVPDLTRQLFGPKAGKVAAWLTLLYMLPVAYVLSLGMLLHMLLGISITAGMLAGVTLVGAFCAWGGLRSIVFSDVVQFAVMCSVVALVAVFSVHTFGGMDFLKAHLPASHFSVTGGNSWANTLVWGFIALSVLIDPSFYQRCFAANDLSTVKKGILLSTGIWFLFDLCTTVGSLYARAVLPQAQPGQAYFFYALQLLPAGLRGLFVAGILSIILSTLDSFLFIASNTLSYDLLKERFPRVVLSGRISIFVAGFLAVGLAHLFQGSFKEIWLVLGSYFSACLLVPVLWGQLRPGTLSEKGFITAVLCSMAIMTAWQFGAPALWREQVASFYIGVAVSLVILLCFGKGVKADDTRTAGR